jgi:hypothetical protein
MNDTKRDSPLFTVLSKPGESIRPAPTVPSFMPARQPTEQERKAIADQDVGLTVIAGEGILGKVAISTTSDLAQYAMSEFGVATEVILQVKNNAQPGEHTMIMDAFGTALIGQLGQQVTGLLTLSVQNIAKEVHLNRHPAPPRPPGFWERMFGTGE